MDAQEADINRGLPATEHGPTDVSNPLLGVVLCCTSVPPEKRTKLAEQAQQMGAQHKYDLTSEVTHLIVGDYDTPKYRYVAKERPDVKVVTVDWIEAVRQLWIADKPIDVDALEREHCMPTFASLKICLTGFEDPAERAGIADLVRANGALYHGDLTKAVTHLIANKPEGSKYKHAKMWGLRIVSLEWITHSIERGMILEEKLYNPELPPEQRGKDAWNRRAVVKSPSGKRRHEAIAGLDEGKRKLRRTASTRLTSQNENIWGDIVGGASLIQAAASGVWDSAEDLLKHNDSSTVERSKPFIEPAEVATEPVTIMPRGTFSDCRFYVTGFDAKKFQVLQRHLTSHDGEISMSPEEFVMPCSKQLFLLVPHSVPENGTPDLPECEAYIQTVTEWWVERCLDVKAFVDPSEYTFGRPFRQFPIPKFSDLTVCSTGFDGTQLLHLSKAVALLGAKYEESFSKSASVLICNSGRPTRREKLISAQEWRIPLVSIDWLLDSIETGARQRYQQYLRRPQKPKLELGFAPVVDEDLTRQEKHERLSAKPESEASFSRSLSSKEGYQQPKLSKLDDTAFQDNPPTIINAKSETSTATTVTTEPLTDISPNSPGKPPSPSKPVEEESTPAPTVPQEAISTAITSLLAKSKHTTHPSGTDITDARKKRAPSRILGRAASIASNSGTSLSRASSVDSTASTGAAVIWPSATVGKNQPQPNAPYNTDVQTSSLNMRSMTTGGGEESQPPQTQMQYNDAESSEYKARVMEKLTGEKVVRKEVTRVATVASLREAPKLRKTRLRDRMGSKG